MKYGCLVAMIAATLLLASCGGGSGSDTAASAPSGPATDPEVAARPPAPQPKQKHLQHLDLTLAGWEGPESAGIVLAERNGYFADAGLDVAVLTPVAPVNSMKYVVEGDDDLGVVPMPQVVLASEKGLPIVAVGSLISQPTAAMISLRSSGIDGIEDLKGKTVAFPGLSSQKEFLERLLARAGLTPGDVELEPVGYGLVQSLVSGRAEAIFGGSSNIEGVELESRGLHPVVTPVTDFGIPAYEQLVVITRRKRAADDPEMVRGFMTAVRRGVAAAIKDPRAALAAIETSDEPNSEASRKDTEAEMEATLPLLSKTARMSPRRVRRLVAWMQGQGLIQGTPPVSSLLTNRHLQEARGSDGE